MEVYLKVDVMRVDGKNESRENVEEALAEEYEGSTFQVEDSEYEVSVAEVIEAPRKKNSSVLVELLPMLDTAYWEAFPVDVNGDQIYGTGQDAEIRRLRRTVEAILGTDEARKAILARKVKEAKSK